MNVLKLSYFFILIYGMIFCIFKQKQRKILFLTFSGIQLILLFALRDVSVGVDIIRYERSYEWIGMHTFRDAISIKDNYENIAYFLLNFIFSKLGVPYQFFLGVVGGTSVIPVLYIIYLYASSPCLSVLIYLSFGIYAFQFSGLKQTIAMSIVLIAFIFLKKEKKKYFYLFIVLAILFHPTAIITLPLYWILTTNRAKIMVVFLAGIVFFTFMFRNQIGYRLTYIYNSNYLGRYESSGFIGTTAILLIGLLIVYIALFQKRISCPQYEESQYFRLLLICTSIQFLSSYAYAFTRLNYYYLQFMPLIVDQLISLPVKSKNNKNEKYLIGRIVWLLFFIACYFLYQSSIINGTNTYNYEFFF